MNDRVKADASLVLSPEELAEISKHAVARSFRPRTVLVSEGEKTDALYIIVEGKARAYVGDASGREVVLSIMGPGEYFGEIAFDAGPRSASVITVDACKMLVVPQTEFAEFVKGNPAFAMSFIRKLIHQVRVLTENVRSLAQDSGLPKVGVTTGSRHGISWLMVRALASSTDALRALILTVNELDRSHTTGQARLDLRRY